MTINKFRTQLKKRKQGVFRLLDPGELTEAHDVIVGLQEYDWIADVNVGTPVRKGETILRLLL